MQICPVASIVSGGVLQVDIEHVEARGLGDAGDLDGAAEPHGHRGDHLAAGELVLDVVAQDVARGHFGHSFPVGQLAWPDLRAGAMITSIQPAGLRSVMNYDTNFKSVKDQVSPEEWQARVELAACYRLIDQYGMTDLIYNHITARIPGTEHLLINLYGLLYKEITASSLVKIDVEGEIIAKPDTDYGINKSGYVIHGAIHKARPDVKCVLHTHTRAGIAVSAMNCGLLPLSQTSIRFHNHIGYHDFEGPAVDLEERERIVKDLGEHNALMMKQPRPADLRAVGAGGVQPDVSA